MDHFGARVAQILDREGDGTLHTAQIIVDTKAALHEERASDTAKLQSRS